MARFSNNADVWISEDGDTWIKVETSVGTYAYNKTKMDANWEEMMNRPIKFTLDGPPEPRPFLPDYSSYVTPPAKPTGWIVA